MQSQVEFEANGLVEKNNYYAAKGNKRPYVYSRAHIITCHRVTYA